MTALSSFHLNKCFKHYDNHFLFQVIITLMIDPNKNQTNKAKYQMKCEKVELEIRFNTKSANSMKVDFFLTATGQSL